MVCRKAVFEQLGVQKGRGDGNDYLDGAIFLLQSKGIENDQITETLPEADRGRVYSRTSPMEQMDSFAAELLEDLRLKAQQSKTPMSQD